jgi:MYXO-CTERM domain-containing protein
MTNGRCVACLVDDDCPAPMVCDGTTHSCLECTSAETQNCGVELAGSQCLADGRCGCTQDSDCGGPTSGRVCDPASSRCVPGCRGMGGNTCPAGQPCSSSTSDIGRCNGQFSSDGGADASDGGATSDAAPSDGGATPDAAPSDGGRDAAAHDAAADGGAAGGASGHGGSMLDAAVDHGGLGGAGGTTDGSSVLDAGRDAPGADANAPGGYIAGGGCGCSTAEASTPIPIATFILLVLFALRRRTARARRRD